MIIMIKYEVFFKKKHLHLYTDPEFLHINTSKYFRIHIQIHKNINLYTYIHKHIHMHILHIHRHVCIYICICIYISKKNIYAYPKPPKYKAPQALYLGASQNPQGGGFIFGVV
jgi:hypothetical protein